MQHASFLTVLVVLLPTVSLAQSLRSSADQRGDAVVIGTTNLYDCGAAVAPIVGTVESCGTGTLDTSGDIFWRADEPSAGAARASASLTLGQARTTAALQLPAGAEVTYARLYWAAKGSIDTTVTLDRQGAAPLEITADVTWGPANSSYQASADVTEHVRTMGPGGYRVSGIDSINPANLFDDTFFSSWWLVVFYRNDAEALRHLALVDGLVPVVNGSVSATVTNFVAQPSAANAKLTVVAYEGDSTLSGDGLTFEGVPLSNAANSAANVFNSTRSTLGTAQSTVGDLPQLSGTAGSVQGLDLDVFDVTSQLTANQASATITASASSDAFLFSALVLSVPTARPAFPGFRKRFTDLNGGLIEPGDTLQFVVSGQNTGSEAAHLAEVSDPLPSGVTYVPGSLSVIVSGLVSPVTDAAGDDRGEYVAAARRVQARLGVGATASIGGTLATGDWVDFTYRVTVNPGAPDPVSAPATLTVSGPLSFQSVVDVVPPETTISNAPSAATNSASVTFVFSASEPASRYTLSVNGAPFVESSSLWFVESFPEGTHTLVVHAVDQFGNVDQTPATYTWTIDRTAPQPPVIVTPVVGATLNVRRPVFSGTAEPLATITVFFGPTPLGTTTADASGAWTFTPVTDLADGTASRSARARDAAGNSSPASAFGMLTIDTVAPPAPVVTTPVADALLTSGFVRFAGSAESGSSVTLILDGVPLTTLAAMGTSWTFSPPSAIADGTHTLSVQATDRAGNGSPPTLVTFTIDTARPAPPVILTPAAGATVASARPVITGTAEPGATVIVLDFGAELGTTVADASGAWTFTPGVDLAQGPRNFTARARDAAGNISLMSAARTVIIDTVPPPTPIVIQPTEGGFTQPRFLVSGTAEPSAFVTVSIDGVETAVRASNTGAWQFFLGAPLSVGAHSLSAWARDAAGLTSPASAPITFFVDTTSPDTSITSGPSTLTNSRVATFQFAANEAVSGYVCVLDGAIPANCPAPPVFSALGDGAHTLQVRALDLAGNQDPTPATWTWTVDATAPATPLILSPPDGSSLASVRPDVSGNAEAQSLITVSIDGVEVGTTTTSATGAWVVSPVVALAEGPHVVQVTATDVASNVSPPASASFVVDTTAPAAPVVSAPGAGEVVSATPVAAGTAEPLSTVTVLVDGTAAGSVVANAAGAWALALTSPLADGTHTVRASSVDGAGNSSPLSSTISFTVDGTAPDTTLTSGPSGVITSTTARFEFSATEGGATFECSLDGAAFTPCSAPQSVSGLADGAHTFEVRARDVVGNVDSTPATRTFTVRSDRDGDGLGDAEEVAAATNPDDGDSDDDGVGDGDDGVADTDGDGAIDALDSDSDGDGLRDGTERGVTVSTAPAGTDTSAAAFVADADPSTTTNARAGDSDADGLPDGVEDRDRDGRAQPTETDATDADTDDDGLGDGAEDVDLDGLVGTGETSGRLADSDGDGVSDGVERGVTMAGPGTDPTRFVADADPGSTTDPLVADTDGGGLTDGAEDVNANGRVDAGEKNPGAPDDDGFDADEDGLDLVTERMLGTDPADADSDDDGLVDGLDGRTDTDGDGRIDALDTDSDGDLLTDGVEDSDRDGSFDPGETDRRGADTDGDGLRDGTEDSNLDGRVDAGETDPRLADTDGDGRVDGAEDSNHDGRVDAGETDPRIADTDGDGVADGAELDSGTDPLVPEVPGPTGCGCQATPASTMAWLGLVLAAVLRRNRRARAEQPRPVRARAGGAAPV